MHPMSWSHAHGHQRPRRKGLKLRKELFGDKAVEQRMTAFGEFGEPLQHIINAYAYGDVWSRPGLSLASKVSP